MPCTSISAGVCRSVVGDSVRVVAALLMIGTVATGCSQALASGFEVTIQQLTSNNTVDQFPQIWGSNVVWQGVGGSDGGTDNEIFLFDGISITQLTTNTVHDLNPRVSSAGVYWERGAGTAAEVIYHNGVTETGLTSNSVADVGITASGNLAAWVQGAGTAQDIMLWNGTSATNITAGLGANVVDRLPHTDGSSVVWVRGSVPNQSVVKYDGSTYSTVASSTLAMDDPRVSGQYVVWEGNKGTGTGGVDREIYLYDGSIVKQISDNAFPDNDPMISGDKVVWWGGTFNNFSIFLYDILTESLNTLYTGGIAQFPQIDGDYVVWQGRAVGESDLEIFLWDGFEVRQITDNNYNDSNPRIFGNQIVWQGQLTTAGTSLEIFHATFVIPEPSTVTLAMTGLAVLLGLALRRNQKRS